MSHTPTVGQSVLRSSERMNRRATAYRSIPSAVLSELHRDVSRSLIHTLGTISGAMGLHAETARLSPGADHGRILHELAEQLRDVRRVLSIMSGPRDDGLLSGTSSFTAAEVRSAILQVVPAVLARRVALTVQVEVPALHPARVTTFIHLLMLACKELSIRQTADAATIEVHLARADRTERAHAALQVRADHFHRDAIPRAEHRWGAYASRLVRGGDTRLTWWTRDDGPLIWLCDFALT